MRCVQWLGRLDRPEPELAAVPRRQRSGGAGRLAGLPGIRIPCGFLRSGLPIGLQILGEPFEEAKLLRIARMFEKVTSLHMRRPDVV
jgi:Asp-tRNA(Asn)/Glu-tRNA(Gln) amidotransferase A subunit family amidase